MAETFSLFIPCEAFDVVLSADSDGPTEMEKAVLLFLAAGNGSKLEDVLAFLGLGERLTMDLITKLWQLGYVLVDANQGRVRLEPYWKDLVESGKWTAIPSAHQVSETISLMRELVSGQILEDISTPAVPLSQFSAPVLISSALADAVSQAELAGVAMRNLRFGSALATRSRNVRASMRRRGDSVGRDLGWLRMEFEAESDPDMPGSLTLRPVLGDDIKRARIGPSVASALTAWALDNAEHPAVIELIKTAGGKRPRNGTSLVGRIEALGGRIAKGMSDPLAHQADMEQWRSEIAGFAAEVDALERAHGRVELHTADEGVPAFLKRAVTFEQQLVLFAPTVDYGGLQGLDRTLLRHMRELAIDATAVILWGGPSQRQLPAQCAEYLDNAKAETAVSNVQRIYSAQRSARIAGALAVIDGRRVLYSSASPLDSRAVGGDFAFVLEITTEPPSPIPQRLLEIARERVPDFDTAEQIDLKPWRWNRPRQTHVTVSRPVEVTDEEAVPDTSLFEWGEDDGSVVLKAYFRDLHQACRRLAERADGAGSTVKILAGAELYQQALDIVADTDHLTMEATLWLGFGRDESASPGLPLHRSLTDAIAERVRVGLPTIVLAAPLTPPPARSAGRGGGSINISALRRLAEQSPALVTIVDAPDLPGHFICGEERFLAAPDGLASPPVVHGVRLGNRVIGVGIADPELCAAFRAAVAARWPVLVPRLGAVTGRCRQETHPAPTSVVALVEAWRKAAPGRRRTDLLSAMIGTGDEKTAGVARAAQALLDLTFGEAQDSSTRDLRSDTLAVAAAHGPAALANSALTELAGLAWREGRWHEVALILDAAPDAAGGVPPELAAAAAAVSVGLPAPDLVAFLAHSDHDRWLAGVALAVKAVLFNADEELASALEIKLLDPAPLGAERLAALAEAILAYWAATMEGVDPATIRAIARKDEMENDLRALACTLVKEFRLAADRRYNNSMLKRVVPRVYSDVSGLKPVVEMIQEDGAGPWPAVLKGLTAALGEGRIDIVELADEMFEEARRTFGRETDEKIFKGRGKGAGIHEQAHEVLRRALALRATIQSALAAPDRAASAAMRKLLAVLQADVPSLPSLHDDLPPGAVAAPLLTDLHAHLSQMLSAGP